MDNSRTYGLIQDILHTWEDFQQVESHALELRK